MFCIFWVLGSSALGKYLSHRLEQQKRAQVSESAALVKQDIEKELENLRKIARLLATKQSIISAVEQASVPTLRQEFLPLSSILNTDIIEVIGNDAQAILSTRSYELNDATFQNQRMKELLLAGADLSSIVSMQNPDLPVLMGTAPFKNDDGIIGGLSLGTAVDTDFLERLTMSIDGELVVAIDGKVMATTLPPETDIPANAFMEDTHPHDTDIELQGEMFTAEHIHFDRATQMPVHFILLSSQDPLIQGQRNLWLFISGVTLLVTLITAAVGYYLANAVSKPIRKLSQVSRRVIEERNFEVQSSIATADEIGILSNDLNQLIRWVHTYTHELEASKQTLEHRVEERTQALSVALAELQDMQSQLIQTEKMSSLGQMVAGIAHEINNPISFIHGNLKPLLAYVQDIVELLDTYNAEYPNPSDLIVNKREEIDIDFVVEDLDKLCGSIKMGTERVREIVISLRNYSRLDEAAIKEVNLCDGLDSTLLILGHRLKEGVEVIKHYEPLPEIACSPAQLNQVFTNIIGNAIDAMIEADVKPKQLVLTTCVPDAEHVQVSIKDNGVGMPPDVKAKIFDPFFTTKTVGKGTGLGLGICFKIIEQHQGTLEVISEVGQGTEFVITLPKSTQIA
ncbi:MAG: ATP-binding protein [Cyanobacteria bacterium J06627_28]